MSTDSSQDMPTPPDESQHYLVPSTPPPQSTDLGDLVNTSGVHLPQPGPPSPPHPPPRPTSPAARIYVAPTESELLAVLSAAGKLRDVHQILAQYILAHEPDPVTGQLDLSMFTKSVCQAIASNRPAIVSYLFFMRVGRPSDYVFHALKARSTSIFEIFLQHGWDINQPVAQMEAPVLGYV
jgi:hypothetical protein